MKLSAITRSHNYWSGGYWNYIYNVVSTVDIMPFVNNRAYADNAKMKFVIIGQKSLTSHSIKAEPLAEFISQNKDHPFWESVLLLG